MGPEQFIKKFFLPTVVAVGLTISACAPAAAPAPAAASVGTLPLDGLPQAPFYVVHEPQPRHLALMSAAPESSLVPEQIRDPGAIRYLQDALTDQIQAQSVATRAEDIAHPLSSLIERSAMTGPLPVQWSVQLENFVVVHIGDTEAATRWLVVGFKDQPDALEFIGELNRITKFQLAHGSGMLEPILAPVESAGVIIEEPLAGAFVTESAAEQTLGMYGEMWNRQGALSFLAKQPDAAGIIYPGDFGGLVRFNNDSWGIAIKAPRAADIGAVSVTPSDYAELVASLSEPVMLADSPQAPLQAYATLRLNARASDIPILAATGKPVPVNLHPVVIPQEGELPTKFAPVVKWTETEGAVANAVQRNPDLLDRVTGGGRYNFSLELDSAVKTAAREAGLALANTALIVVPIIMEQHQIDTIASSIDSSFALTSSDKAEVAKDIAQGGNPQCEVVIYQKRIKVPFSKILPAGTTGEVQVPIVLTTESNNGLGNITLHTLPIFTPLAVALKLSEGNAIGCNPFRFAIQQPDENGNVLFRFDPSMDDKQKKWGIEVYDGGTKVFTVGKPEVIGITTLDYYRGFKFRVPLESEGKSLEFRYSDDKTSVKVTRDKDNFIFVVEQKGTKT